MTSAARPTPRHGVRRRLATLLLALLGALGIVAGTAAPALAHADLVQTTPTADAVLKSAPQQVTLTFSEGVELGADAVQVYDDRRRLVDTGPASHAPGHDEVVTQPLDKDLGGGTYTVTWRITSDDSHVESGSFTFSLRAPSVVTPTVPTLSGSDDAKTLLGVTRGIGYVGVAAGLGALLVALVLWPAGLTRSATTRTVFGGLGALIVATGAAMLLQQIDATGASLTALFSGPVLQAAPTGRFGHVMLLRLGATALVALCAWLLMRSPARGSSFVRRGALALLAAGSVALIVSWPLAGHASTGPRVPLSLTVTSVHVAAMVVWLGGLALLLPLAVRARTTELAALLPRFSPVAFGCVGLIVGTGVYQSWREVGSVGALTSTTYGRILLAKVALVAVLIGLGNLARRWVQRRYAPGTSLPRDPVPDAWPAEPRPAPVMGTAGPRGTAYALTTTAVDERPRTSTAVVDEPALARIRGLRRGLAAEVITAMLVLAATAALTGTARAKDTYAPAYTAVATGPVTVDVQVDHAHTGAATITLTETTPDGRAQPAELVTGELAPPDGNAPAVPVRFTAVDASHQRAAVQFSASGTWVLRVFVQTSGTQAVRFSTPIPVR